MFRKKPNTAKGSGSSVSVSGQSSVARTPGNNSSSSFIQNDCRKKSPPRPRCDPIEDNTNTDENTDPVLSQMDELSLPNLFGNVDDAESNPRQDLAARQDFFSQTQQRVGGDAYQAAISRDQDTSYEGPIIEALRRFDVEVIFNDDVNADTSIFHIGSMNHLELVRKIDSIWGKSIETTQKYVTDLKSQLSKDEKYWKLFLHPTKNYNGIQDTIMRALILSKAFQLDVFSLVYRKLDEIARANPSEETLSIGRSIILQLRYITEVVSSRNFFIIVFDKKLEHWTSELRDSFITILPELFTDSSVHSDAANHLLEYILYKGISQADDFRQSCMEALKQLQCNPKVQRKIQICLMKFISQFDVPNIALAVETVLRSTDPRTFCSFLACLHRFLDIAKLQRIEQDNMSQMSLDQGMAKVFQTIADFMNFNAVANQRELLKFYALQKISRRTVEGGKSSPVNDDGSGSEYSPDEADEDDEEADNEAYLRREFDLIDVMLLLAFNSIKSDSAVVIKELRKQIEISHDTYLTLKSLFSEALSFNAFASTFYHSVVRFARDLIRTTNDRLNVIGGVILKQLFYQHAENRSDTLLHIVAHFSKLESETTVALEILEEIAENNKELLRPFLDDLNELLDHLDVLSTDNIRRLFFVLVSIHKYKDLSAGMATQSRRMTSRNNFLNRLYNYLSWDVPRKNIWGIVGLVQYIKALLLFSTDNEKDDVDNEVKSILNKLDQVTSKAKGEARAEFFYQMSELLKFSRLTESNGLIMFGNTLMETVKSELFVKLQEDRRESSSEEGLLGQFNAEEFVNPQTSIWINLGSLVLAEDESLDGPVMSLLPMMQLIKDFCEYRYSFSQDSDDPQRKEFWNTLWFFLEANVDLSGISRANDLTVHDTVRRCHVLYVTVEYLRTMLNLFSGCLINDTQTKMLFAKKLNLLIFCQFQLQAGIKKLGSYQLPRINRVNSFALSVKFKDSANKGKPGRKKTPVADKEGDTDMDVTANVLDETAVADVHREATPPNQQVDCDSSQFTFSSFLLRKSNAVKSISVDQLRWYLTPFRLEILTKLIETIGMKRRQTLALIENLHVVLKHTMPTTGKQAPPGFGFGGVPPPFITMDFGDKNSRWNVVALSIPALFDVLSRTVDSFSMNTAQAPVQGSSDYRQEMANLLRFSVMIFSRIFQSRDIAATPDPCDSDQPVVLTRRASILAALTSAIGVFNSSRIPHTQQDQNTTCEISRSNDGFTVRSSRVSSVEPPGDNEVVIDFFLEVAKFVPTLESAAAMIGLLKTFQPMSDFHARKAAETAIFYLSKDWMEDVPDGDSDVAVDSKHAYQIASDYIYFRPLNERLSAIMWLISNQLTSVFSPSFVAREPETLQYRVEDSDIVKLYSDTTFPCFTKKSFPTWHKLLFKWFTDTVISHLRENNADLDRTTLEFLHTWKNVGTCFNIMATTLKAPEHRQQAILMTCAREGRRFISFFLARNSSFRGLIVSKNHVAAHREYISRTIQFVQRGNRTLQLLRNLAKEKKNAALLRLIPELNVANEKMMREFQIASVQGGFDANVTISYLKPKTLETTQSSKRKSDGTPVGRRNKKQATGDDGSTPAASKKKSKSRKSVTVSQTSEPDSAADDLFRSRDVKRELNTSTVSGQASGFVGEPVDNISTDQSGDAFPE